MRIFIVATILYISGLSCVLADFRSVMVTRFSADPTYLVINMPPRPGAWPGAIFTSNLRIPIKYGEASNPALRKGPKIAIEAKDGLGVSGGAKTGVQSLFGLSAEASDVAEITMSFPDAQIVDMNYDDLIKTIESSEVAASSVKKGQIPIVVIKAYVGTPVVNISKKLGASSEAWAKLKVNVEAGAHAKISSDNLITYTAGEAFPFAFETSQIEIDPVELAKGKSIIRLSSYPTTLFAYRDNVSADNIASAIANATGISLKDLKELGVAGRPSNIFTHPFKF